jgi:hypothetical protein
MKKNKQMKAIKFSLIITFSILLLAVVSCVEDNEYDIPPTATQVEPDVTANSSIEAMKGALDQHFASNGESKMIIDEDSDLVFSGYVVSSDLAGNFFESIVLQDSPSNPTGGIEVLIDKSSLFETYDFGRKVYVKMAGLSISYEDGESNVPFGLQAAGSFFSDTNSGRYTIGIDNGGFGLDEIPQSSSFERVLRSTEIEEIIATPVSSSVFMENQINTFIEFTSAQFRKTELNKTFAGESSDEFDGFRSVVRCEDQFTALLQTSTFADFKSYSLPTGAGIVKAVLAKDFRADFFVLVVNSPIDIDFSNSERCDPEVLECDGVTSTTNTVFIENFDGVFDNSDLTDLGWTNINVSGGSELFESNSFSGDRYMKISASGTGENPMETWLISPAINLDSSTEEKLSFEISANLETGQVLTILITKNFTGDVATTEWTQLDVEIPVGNGSFGDFIKLNTNISCLNGDVNVAFKYYGYDSAANTRYHIDDVKITGM